jgi:tRNA pseudouridine55 synthase
MIGFLDINKPEGWTSHDVVRVLKKSLNIKKIGHSGTLDPLASGVLVIGINEATRLFEFLNSDKIYNAKILFGFETNTDDITGEIIKQYNYIPSIEEIKLKLKEFTGIIKQKPPIFSSVKINGKRAYNLARKNKISLNGMKEKTVEIYSIKINSYIKNELDLKIHCSTGTYIRSFARDLGNSLNTGGCLSFLKRTMANKHFSIEKSINPELINISNLNEYLIHPAKVLEIPSFQLNKEQTKDISNGKEIKFNDNSCKIINLPAHIQLLNDTNSLIGIGLIQDKNTIRPQKVLIHD